MRATPTASLSTVTTSSTVSSPGTGTFTVNTVSMTNADKRGCIIALGGATGATAKEDGYVYSSLIKLSARL
jgi:threonine/homoserine/homoserine lactone efflux protein